MNVRRGIRPSERHPKEVVQRSSDEVAVIDEYNKREPEKQKRRARERKGLPNGQTLNGNTVVLRLLFPKGRKKPTKAEERQIEKMMDDLDALLLDPDPTSPPVGNLEGPDYRVPGECRLFLGCPDADRLVEKPRPWLEELRWKGDLLVLKRYGEYVDGDAPEEYVTL